MNKEEYDLLVINLEEIRKRLKAGELDRSLVLDYIDTVFNIDIYNRKERELECAGNGDYHTADMNQIMASDSLGWRCQMKADFTK
jgi:hypothetical protein